MLNVHCRYFQPKSEPGTTEETSVPVLGACTHSRMRRDNPECEGCTIPYQAKRELCPGVSQRFDRTTEQFRYRCTIHRVKIDNPLAHCKSLRNCPLDREEPASIAPAGPSRPLQLTAGSVAAAFARRLAVAAKERAS